MELIKKTIRVGNSAGVLLPKEFLGKEVKIVLQPLNIQKEVLELLSRKKILPQVLGVYLTGSYARGEQTIESDIDILVITDKIDSSIKEGKYDLTLVSEKALDDKMKKNIFPLLPMMIEAKPLINQALLNEYINTSLSRKNLGWHLETTKSAMKVVNEFIKLSNKTGDAVGDSIAYSLILRLRTIYIIDCLKNKRKWSKKEFLELIKKIAGSLKSYERYLESKNKNTKEYKLSAKEAKKLMSYNDKKINEIEKWLKEKKGQERKD